MKRLGIRIGLYAAASAILVGCGGSQLPIGAPGATAESHMATSPADSNRDTAFGRLRVLHTFTDSSGGRVPLASMIDVAGTLYGTTSEGGSHQSGVVFGITAHGEEKLLHNFGPLPEGEKPAAGLVSVNGRLYGTTEYGGTYECRSSQYTCGTVFTLDTKYHERILHSFGVNLDGSRPAANLINVQGTLYGTTVYGGTYGGGTVFSISPSGSEKVVYSFGSPSNDGYNPWAGLLYVNGTLYGTTVSGGTYALGGTVYSITLGGKEHILHNFGASNDGASPLASLAHLNGTLYGTTAGGGAYGGGAVFSISKSGNEKVLYSFGEGTDGSSPRAALTNLNGTLYGTTINGGTHGNGTIFRITTSGKEQVVLNFRGFGYPAASLIRVKKTLIGTTQYGGHHGHGTVFAFKPL